MYMKHIELILIRKVIKKYIIYIKYGWAFYLKNKLINFKVPQKICLEKKNVKKKPVIIIIPDYISFFIKWDTFIDFKTNRPTCSKTKEWLFCYEIISPKKLKYLPSVRRNILLLSNTLDGSTVSNSKYQLFGNFTKKQLSCTAFVNLSISNL